MHLERGGRPFTARLLARPEAAGVLAELRLAFDLQVGITTLRGRRPEITYLREDPHDADRITGALGPQAFTRVDRALFLALREHEATLCPGCGWPKAIAYHSDAAASVDATQAVCHVCTKQQGVEVAYSRITSDLTEEAEQNLQRFEWGVTTTSPQPPAES